MLSNYRKCVRQPIYCGCSERSWRRDLEQRTRAAVSRLVDDSDHLVETRGQIRTLL